MSDLSVEERGQESRLVRLRFADEQPGITCAPVFDVDAEAASWEQRGSFVGADGRSVRAYDDVVFLRDVLPENDLDAAYVAKAGSTGTILFFSTQPHGVAQVELNGWNAVVLAYEEQRFLKLHVTNEEKYPR